MNESIETRRDRNGLRRKLLLTASSVALLVSLSAVHEAKADDSDRPVLWIDLGGAFDQMSRGAQGWEPPNLTPPISNPPPEPFGRVPELGYDFDAAISFQPDDSMWVYSASVKYGRAQFGPKHNHDQTYVLKTEGISHKYVLTNYDFANATQQSHSSHAVLDFNVGRDVGLGLFNGGKSTIHFGVRVAQLNEKSDADLIAFVYAPAKYSPSEVSHRAEANISRSFIGAGPSVSWDGSEPMIGSLKDGISFDWGANVAILFGRQKTHIALHTEDAQYYKISGQLATRALSQSTATPVRNKTAIVPNVGGLVGISYRRSNAKVSLGYRADFFFGAVDGGLATSQRDTRGFYGPFAKVSIGIGG